MATQIALVLAVASALALACQAHADDPVHSDASRSTIRIICLGDSITKGARPGVAEDETYEAQLHKQLATRGIATEIINVGLGGERTDQAVRRLDADVIARKPALCTVMYGTNDSAVDQGGTEPRLPIADYEANLRRIVAALRAAGIVPLLMTPPPLGDRFDYMAWSPYKERGPNHLLVEYVRRVRNVADEEGVALVDNFARWAEVQLLGTDLDDLMTDGCHPNPLGQRLIAETMQGVVVRATRRP